jgi:mono/diheme cytochrome c family protein
MIGNILGFLVIILLMLVFGWLTWRAWHSRRAWIKWVGGILSALLTMIFLLVGVLAVVGFFKFYTPRNYPIPAVSVAGTPEQVARGEHIAAVLCASCHSTSGELPLTGGKDSGAEIPIPIGSMVSYNLTPGGPLKDWSDGEIFRAIRSGIDRTGHSLAFMGTTSVRNLSDADLQAVIAYLRSQAPVTNQVQGGDHPTFFAGLLMGAGLIPQPAAIAGSIDAPPVGATAEYGKYIVSFQGCRDCHGVDLTGGGGLAPPGPSLRLVKGWTQEQFVNTIRNGVDPGGHQLSDTMPWKIFAKMDDTELAAMYAYLHDLP